MHESLYVRMMTLVPGFLPDWDLLMLAFPEMSSSVERLVVAHLEVW